MKAPLKHSKKAIALATVPAALLSMGVISAGSPTASAAPESSSVATVASITKAAAVPTNVAQIARTTPQRNTYNKLSKVITPIIKNKDMAVAIYDYKTGLTWTYRGSRAYNMASLVKAGTAASLLTQRSAAGRSPSLSERNWMKAALQLSDNNAQNNVWNAQGGLSRYVRTVQNVFKMTSTRPGPTTSWGRSLSTANDQMKLFRMIAEGKGPLGSANASWMRSTMRGVASWQRWGAGNIPRSSSTIAFNKNGWSPYSDTNKWRLNSAGYVKDAHHNYVIVILSNGWRTMDSGLPSVNAVGRNAYNALTR